MENIKNVELKGKKVILRCDFNVPVKNGIITDDTKIKESFPTLSYLINNCEQLVILSHFGRIKSEEDKEKNSLRVVFNELKKYIPDIDFIEDPSNIIVGNNKCYLVENTRYTDIYQKTESANSPIYSEYLSSFGDVFVMDAPASLHRSHSSTAGIAEFLPTYSGFLVDKELRELEKLTNDVKHPFVVVMGGSKIDDKIDYIKGVLNYADKVIITGGLLNTFYKVMGYKIGQKSLQSDNPEILKDVKELLEKYSDKLVLSKDITILKDDEIKKTTIDEVQNLEEEGFIIYDNFIQKEHLMSSKTVFVNGTCGYIDDSLERFNDGTIDLLNCVNATKASVKIAGGGNAVEAVKKFGFETSFDSLLTGGGASLEYISTHKLKALDDILSFEMSKKKSEQCRRRIIK